MLFFRPKMRYFCLFITVAIFFLQKCSALGTSPNKNVSQIFVDGKDGSNIPNCGQEQQPCKSVSYAVGKILEENSTNGIINLFPGTFDAESIKVDCTSNRLQSLLIQGIRNGTNRKAQVTLSAYVVKCDIVFNNIQWTSSLQSRVLINLLVANISIVNSMITDLPFSIIGLGSSIKLWHTMLTNCIGYQPCLPLVSASGLKGLNSNIVINATTFSSNNAQLISAKEMTAFHMEKSKVFSNNATVDQKLILIDRCQSVLKDSHFMNNSGTVMKMTQATSVDITSCSFGNNDVLSESLFVVGKQVILHIVGCLFSSTYGTSSGPVLRNEQGASSINIKSSYFSCNRVNDSFHLPPVYSHTLPGINCTNCTIDPQCPVYCSGGSYLLDSVMCSPCPKGTYSTGRVHNITTIACTKCSPGYYSSSLGSNACHPCKEGSFAEKSGSTQCFPCRNDLVTSGVGEPSCSRMTIGCIVLTVFIIILILIPLLLLAWKHFQGSTITREQTDFKRLSEDFSGTIQVQRNL